MTATQIKIGRLSPWAILDADHYTPAEVSLWQMHVMETWSAMDGPAWHAAVRRSAPLIDDEIEVLGLAISALARDDLSDLPGRPWVDYSPCVSPNDFWTAAWSAALRRAADRIRLIADAKD